MLFRESRFSVWEKAKLLVDFKDFKTAETLFACLKKRVRQALFNRNVYTDVVLM
jgi:hypothetical protein